MPYVNLKFDKGDEARNENRESIVLRRSTEFMQFLESKVGDYKDPDSEGSNNDKITKDLCVSEEKEIGTSPYEQKNSFENTCNMGSKSSGQSNKGFRLSEELSLVYEKVLKEASGERRTSDHRSFASYIKEHNKTSEFTPEEKNEVYNAVLAQMSQPKSPESKKLTRNSDVLVSFAAAPFIGSAKNPFEQSPEEDVKSMLGGIYNRLVDKFEDI
jgi:hypothetical protein